MQIAKARGAYVIGTASRGKHDLLHDLGIDEAIDYRAEAFERAIEPVDVVYDLIGGDVAKRSLDVLHPDGRLICLPSAAAAEAMAAAADRGLRPPACSSSRTGTGWRNWPTSSTTGGCGCWWPRRSRGAGEPRPPGGGVGAHHRQAGADGMSLGATA